jgi:hypothetical protein
MDFYIFCFNSGLNRCQVPCVSLADDLSLHSATFAIQGPLVVSCPTPVWWVTLLGFCNFCNLGVNRFQLPCASKVDKSLGLSASLQVKVEVALCQFGGQVFLGFCNFCNLGLNRCQLPFASLVGKSLGFLQL